MPLLADVSFGQLLLLVVEIFLFVIWIWILIAIIGDLFRDHGISGVVKAVWLFFLVIVPFLSALVYLIVRGDGMRDRTLQAQTDAKAEFDRYIREQANVSPADELGKLHDLREKGAITEEEFGHAKSRLLGPQASPGA